MIKKFLKFECERRIEWDTENNCCVHQITEDANGNKKVSSLCKSTLKDGSYITWLPTDSEATCCPTIFKKDEEGVPKLVCSGLGSVSEYLWELYPEDEDLKAHLTSLVFCEVTKEMESD